MAEMRALWNSWDPIGVASSEITDEYNGYLGRTMRLLERDASLQEIVDYLKWVTNEQMGLGMSSGHEQFAEQLCKWFSASWRGTRVPGT